MLSSQRQQILDFASSNYGTEAEYLWRDYPRYAVLRHPRGKWYGVIMDVPYSKLGVAKNGITDILVTKCPQFMQKTFLGKSGFLPAYHMNKTHWITVLLDGSASLDDALTLLDMSYSSLSSKRLGG